MGDKSPKNKDKDSKQKKAQQNQKSKNTQIKEELMGVVPSLKKPKR